MTSLFHRTISRSHGSNSQRSGTRSSSRDGSQPTSGGAPGRPQRVVQRLELEQAMGHFRSMFPGVERPVIESVLWANHGVVEATIEQLLQMSLDANASEDSDESDDSIPQEILERTLEPDSSDEEAPPIYAPPSYDMHIYDRKYPLDVPNTPPPRFESLPPPPALAPTPAPAPAPTTAPAAAPPAPQPASGYRNWNPPLLGNLPDDFLRILPQQRDSLQRSQSTLSHPSSSSSSSLSSLCQPLAAVGGSVSGNSVAPPPGGELHGGGGGEQERIVGRALEEEEEEEEERRLRQFLEDERVALFLQNEEFMRELQRNRDFLVALERGEPCVLGSGDGCCRSGSTSPDEALLRDKLKHMGKSTRKKLLEIARSLSEKTRRKKTKKKCLSKHHSLGSAVSTANLLGDAEGTLGEGIGQLKTPETQEAEEPNKELPP